MCSSRLSFVVPDTAEMQKKYVGGFMELICLTIAGRMCGHGMFRKYVLQDLV
jgi:hypothetical protein